MAHMTLDSSVGSGTARFSETGSRTVGDAYNNTTFITYEFVATASAGWRFDHWEYQSRLQNYTSSGGAEAWTGWTQWFTPSSSPTYSREFTCENAYDYGETWGSGGTHYEYKVRAVFVQIAQYTVSVVADPVAGGTVTGGGQYQAGASCTITATPNNNYIFVKWVSSDGYETKNNPYAFTVTNDITWTAKFHFCTNLLIHNSSNTLIHGASGTLLHDA